MPYVKQKHQERLPPCREEVGGKCTIRDEKTFKKITKRARNTGNHVQEPGKKYGADDSL